MCARACVWSKVWNRPESMLGIGIEIGFVKLFDVHIFIKFFVLFQMFSSSATDAIQNKFFSVERTNLISIVSPKNGNRILLRRIFHKNGIKAFKIDLPSNALWKQK